MDGSNKNRYRRQTFLSSMGEQGQERLNHSRVLLVGWGALGTVLAELLSRAGVGHLTIADRDLVEPSNLQRQTLFDESQAKSNVPKAIAAAERLCQINSSITVDPHVIDVHSGNIESLVFGGRPPANSAQPAGGNTPHLILDGTDNAETRYLLNDLAIKHKIPWIYGACVGSEGRVMPIIPGRSPCLQCIFPQAPAPGDLATCDTSGVLGPAAACVGSFQAAMAIKLLIGRVDAIADELITLDLWSNRTKSVSLSHARRADCPLCGLRQFNFLETAAPPSVSLCGRNSIQIRPTKPAMVDLHALRSKLFSMGSVESTPYFVRR